MKKKFFVSIFMFFTMNGEAQASQRAFEILATRPDILEEYDIRIISNEDKDPPGAEVRFDSNWDNGTGVVFFAFYTDDRIYLFKSKTTTKEAVIYLVSKPLRAYFDACLELDLKCNFDQIDLRKK